MACRCGVWLLFDPWDQMMRIQPTHLFHDFGLYSGGRQRDGVAQSFSHVRKQRP
jgi:hypothetical protein